MNIKDLPHKKAYVEAWKKALANPDKVFKPIDWAKGSQTGSEIAQDFSKALQARINSRGKVIFRGRKYDSDWFWNMWRASKSLNTPRLVIDWLPPDLVKRFGYRLRKNNPDLY